MAQTAELGSQSPIKDQLKYVCSYGTCITDLREGLENLETARKRRQERVDRASYDAEEINVNVTKWLDDVNKISQKAEELLDLKKGCFRGVIPNPSTQLLIAKWAEENKQEIEKLLRRNNYFQRRGCMPQTENSLIKGIKCNLKHLWSYETSINELSKELKMLKDAREKRQDEVVKAYGEDEEIDVYVTEWLDDVNRITEAAAEVLKKHEYSKKGCFRRVISNPSTRVLIAKRADENKQKIQKLLAAQNADSAARSLNDVLSNLENLRKRRQEGVDVAAEIHVDVPQWLDDVNKISEEARKVLKQHEDSKKGCFRGVTPKLSTLLLITEGAEKNKQEIEKLLMAQNAESAAQSPIGDLNDVLTKLENTRKRRREEVVRAYYNAEEINVDVTKWLDDVDKIFKKARKVLKQHEYSKKGCFSGVIPNPSTRSPIDKEAAENKQEIDKLLRRNDNFQSVSCQKVPVETVTGNYKGSESWIVSSRDSLLKDISKALLDPDVSIVGIWGDPGVGKSTFLKQLEKQVQERKLNYDFDVVATVVVSRSPNWEKVLDDLQHSLGAGVTYKNFGDSKAKRIQERLGRGEKFLIILDDIWEEIDLKELGVSFHDNRSNIKLLLTSRSEQVLKSKMESKHNFRLERLEPCEAMELFEGLVGKRVTDESRLVEQLLEECGGLPILISLLAASLKFHPSSAWAKTLTKLRESRSLEIGIYEEKSLQISDDAKSLFLLCAQIGNRIISTNHLVLYGMGLRLLKGVHGVKEAREKVNLLLNNLKASCLLEDHSRDYVKLHDPMADAALSITSNAHLSLVIKDTKLLEVWYNDDIKLCKSLSLHLGKMHALPGKLTCPKLDMLLIGAEGYFHVEIPDAFFQDLQNLKVLHISNLQITSFPSSIGFLSKLNTLCLDGVAVEDIKVVGKLKTLQILILGSITRIPREIGELNGLRLLNLEECSELKVIEPNVLGRLIHLEELILPLHFDRWDAKGISNASLNELNNMSYLSNLVICVRKVASLAIIMPVQQLVQYAIRTGWAWKWTDRGESRSLTLRFDSSSSELIWKECLQTVLKKTQDLHLEGWIGSQDAITKLSEKGFPELKHIHIESCPSIQYITHSEQSNPFPVLETLSLYDLINLQEIWKGGLPFSSLCNLKVIKIIACKELRNLFSFTLVKVLPLLQEIEVSDCPMMREIVTFDEVESINSREIVELKCLQRLKLVNLPNFSSFCSKGTSENPADGRLVSLPCLRSLTLCNLPESREISDIHYKVKLGSLKSLELRGCPSLSYAIDSNLMQQIRTLESLVIVDCKSMETVFNVEIMETDVHEEMLKTHEAISNKSLRTNLKLSKLPRLMKLWNSDLEKIPFLVLLTKLEVSNCDELENLFSAYTVKTLSEVSHISIDSCKKMKEILSKEESEDQKIEFQSLSYLSVSNMENLTMFSHGNRRCQFPSLMQLIITDCPKMKEFVSMEDGKEELSSEDATRGEPFFNKKVDLPSLEKLVLRSLDSLISIWDDNNLSDGSSFKKLESVEIKECKRIQSVFGSHLVKRLEKLTKVKIEGCESLEVLWKIVANDATGVPSLRDISVKICCKLVILFPNAIARTLSKLQNMYISSCELLKEVVTDDGDMDKTEKMEFCNLSSLQLEDLGGLVHFCSGHYELCLPFLKKLSIINCKNLKEFALRSSNLVESEEQSHEISSINNMEVGFSSLFNEKVVYPDLEELQIKGLQVKEIWSKKEPAGSLMKFKKLHVEECHQLSLIVPSFLLHNFCNLELLSVKSCNLMEVIFELEKYRSRRPKISRSKSTENILDHLRDLTVSSCKSVHHIVAIKGDGCIGDTSYKTILPQLTSLKLTNLPSLGTFYTENYEIELPSMVKMVVKDCQTMTLLVADNMDLKPLLFVEKVEFPLLKSMEITDMQNLEELWHITQSERSSKAFCKLEELKVHGCRSLSTLFPLKMIRGFHNLKELSVKECESVERVFESLMIKSGAESNNFNDVVILPGLEKLVLHSLKSLISIWDDNNLSNGSFYKLASIEIRQCAKIQSIFHSHIMKRLQNLREISVHNCESLEVLMKRHSSQKAVISFSSFSSMQISYCGRLKEVVSIYSEDEDKELAKTLRFDNLSFLQLQNLDSLVHFCSRCYELYFPLLEELQIAQCTNLRSFVPMPSNLPGPNEQSQQISLISNLDAANPPLFDQKALFPNLGKLRINGLDVKEIWPREEPESFLINLKELEVECCNQLSTIIPPHMLPNLHSLESLSVKSCHSVEHIVVVRDGNYNGETYYKTVIFPQLSSMELSDLPKLGSFGNKNHRIGLPSLLSLHINQCEAMEVLVADSNKDYTPLLLVEKVAKCLHQLNKLEVVDCKRMEGIVFWNEENANHPFTSTPSPDQSTNFSVGTHSMELEWPSLKTLVLAKCPKAKIFASGQQKVNIPRLEELTIYGSTLESQQFINELNANPTSFVLESIENEAWLESTPWSLLHQKFPNLRKLRIRNSDSKEIFPSDYEKEGDMAVVSYKSGVPDIFDTLEIKWCDQLTILLPSSALFRKLTILKVYWCNGLRYLVTSSAAKGLVHLTELQIFGCDNLEEIVTYDCGENGNRAKDDDGGDMISFPHLKRLELTFLSKLQNFSSTSYRFNFPSLTNVWIHGVTEMHVFCEGDFSAPYKYRITSGIRDLYEGSIDYFGIR